MYKKDPILSDFHEQFLSNINGPISNLKISKYWRSI